MEKLKLCIERAFSSKRRNLMRKLAEQAKPKKLYTIPTQGYINGGNRMSEEQKLCEHEWKLFDITYEGYYATPYEHYICKKCKLEKTDRG